LAAEVEGRLAQDLRGIAANPVTVTGLYGGVDWGPTDAWIQTDRPTVVICTFEKADALLSYLGVLFLDRVRLVIIDEAHMVEQEEARLSGLEDGSSRAFRLEQLRGYVALVISTNFEYWRCRQWPRVRHRHSLDGSVEIQMRLQQLPHVAHQANAWAARS
jgi:hypothetical protein